jgi:hypothetical protein
MSNGIEPRRRFQFSLRTLLIGVTLFAIPCGYVGWQAKIVRDRKAIRERMKSGALFFGPNDYKMDAPAVPWLRSLMGDNGVEGVVILYEKDRDEVQAAFPEAKVDVFEEVIPELIQ